jgi:hypothetical protein
MKTTNATIFILFVLHLAMFSQTHQFDIQDVRMDVIKQEVNIELRTNSFESLNFFNQTKKDFKIYVQNPERNNKTLFEVNKLTSDDLIESDIKEWHIIIASNALKEKNNIEEINTILSKFEKANICNNAFVNVYSLGENINAIYSSFGKSPKLSDLEDKMYDNNPSILNLTRIIDILKPGRTHIICLLTNGILADQISDKDKQLMIDKTIEGFKEYKTDILFFPVKITEKETDDKWFQEVVNATSNGEDQMITMDISPLGKQKDGFFSRKNIFYFTITGIPQLSIGNILFYQNEVLTVNCSHKNNQTQKYFGATAKIRQTLPIISKIIYPIGKNFSYITQILLMVLITLIMIFSLYMVIPLINRATFKKKHVFTYQNIKQAKKSKKDPLTLEEFKCDDQIVVFGDKMMLLETWKYLNKKDNIESAKDYSEFFKGNIEGNIFTQTTGKYKWSFLAFFALAAGSVIFLINVGINILLDYLNIGQSITDKAVFLEGIKVFCFFATLTTISYLAFSIQSNKLNNKYWKGLPLITAIIIVSLGFTLFILLINYFLVIQNLPSMIPTVIFYLITMIGITIFVKKVDLANLPNLIKAIGISTIMCCILHYALRMDFIGSYLGSVIPSCIVLLFGFLILNLILNLGSSKENTKLLKVITPEAYRGTVFPLELTKSKKWSIGNHPENNIYIKWLDYDVRNDHCYIEHDKGVWKIFSFNGEVVKNGVLINNTVFLQENDILSLGRNGITQFKFINGKEDESGYVNVTSGYKSEKPEVHADEESNKKIMIKPKGDV